MSMFQCENCGCAENTALTSVSTKFMPHLFDWAGIENRKGKKLCCVCLPIKYNSGELVRKSGKWHNKFPRVFLKMCEWKTN